jgi:hypothetical protein
MIELRRPTIGAMQPTKILTTMMNQTNGSPTQNE